MMSDESGPKKNTHTQNIHFLPKSLNDKNKARILLELINKLSQQQINKTKQKEVEIIKISIYIDQKVGRKKNGKFLKLFSI